MGGVKAMRRLSVRHTSAGASVDREVIGVCRPGFSLARVAPVGEYRVSSVRRACASVVARWLRTVDGRRQREYCGNTMRAPC